jgi:hypothetical protein
MLPAPLEESGTTSLLGRRRDRLGVALIAALCTVGIAACGGGERQDANEAEGEYPVEITSAEFPAGQSLAETQDLILSVSNSGDEQIPNLAVTIFTAASPDAEVQLDASEADPAQADGEDAEQLADEVEQQLQEELDAEAEQEAAEEEGDQAGTETELEDNEIPITDGPFSIDSQQPGVERPSRPVWILEQGYPTLVGAVIAPGPTGEIAAASGAKTAQTNTFAFGPLDPEESIDMVWRVTPVQAGTYTVRYRIAAGLQGNAVAVNEDGSVPEGEFIVRITDAPPQTRVNDQGEVVPIKPGDISGQVDDASGVAAP